MDNPALANNAESSPTVSRIIGDTLVELVYDRSKRQTRLAVSRDGQISIEQSYCTTSDEVLVPYSPRNNLIAHDCVLLPSEPADFQSKSELVTDIAAFLYRYVDLSPAFARIASYYVLLTWVYDAFAEVPYLRLQGDYGTGKTRALIAIGSLCNKPFFAAGASTVSPIFHTMDRFRGTLILDEADLRFSDATADLVKLLNNGTVRGIPVLRSVQNRHKEYNPTAFDVFGPKIIAMRGSFADEALESRFLTEETGVRPLREDIPLHQPDGLQAEALALRNRLLHFRLVARPTIAPHPAKAVASLDARLNQIALPLLSLIDDDAVRSEIVALLTRDRERRAAARADTLEARVLTATLAGLAISAGRDTPVQLIADCFNRAAGDTGHPVTPKRIGGILKQAFRVSTRKSHGSYVIAASERTRLEAIAARYGVSI